MDRQDKLEIIDAVAKQYNIDLPEEVTQLILEAADTQGN